MATKKEPTQETPQGQEIPVPKRGDVLRDLAKIAKANKPASDDRGSGAGDQK
jgi:hypothetical protein